MKLKPIVALPVCDRLAYILSWGSRIFDHQKQMVAAVERRLAKAIEAGRCEYTFVKGARYHLNFNIKLHSGSKALVQVGALQPQRQKGGIRVLVNPSKWLPGDVELLHRTLRRLIGEVEYDELMKHPRINVVDFAVDIQHANLDRMLVTYTNAQQHTVFGKRMSKNGRVETYNFGSVSSDYMTSVYDKRAERIHAALCQLAKHRNGGGLGRESLKANLIKQFHAALDEPERMRVEVRGKKLRGLHLAKLAQLSNRFKRFGFTMLDADGAGLDELTKLAFISICQQYDLKTALTAFKNSRQARKVRKFWRDRQATWWKPEPMWQQACDALRDLGLFPAEAFVDDDEQPAARPKKRR
ncbi:hypothetical protein [Variovorax sp. V512]